MKKLNSFIFILFIPIFIFGQIKEKTTNKNFYIGFQIGSQTNYGSFVTDNADYFSRSDISNLQNNVLEINAGYTRGEHKFELAFKTLPQGNSLNFNIPFNSKYNISGSTGNNRVVDYFALRYYNTIFKLNKKLDIDLGIGVGAAFLKYGGIDGLSFHQAGSTTDYADGTTVSYVQTNQEEIYNKNTFTIEGNLKINWHFNPRWSAVFTSQYLWSPQYIRGNQWTFDIDAGKSYTGIVKTNLTSAFFGLGMQYTFVDRKNFGQLVKTRNPKIIEPDTFQKRFYFGMDAAIFINTGFKGSANYGAINPESFISNTSFDVPVKIGYRFKKNTIELGYQNITNYLAFQGGPWKLAEEVKNFGKVTYGGRSYTGQTLTYIPIRYYYTFSESSKWFFQSGLGLAYARFNHNQATDFSKKVSSSLATTTLSFEYADYERVINKQTVVIEANLQANKKLSKNWAMSFFAHYLYNPVYLRELNFTMKSPNKPDQNGTVATNLSGLGLGLGLQYAFYKR